MQECDEFGSFAIRGDHKNQGPVSKKVLKAKEPFDIYEKWCDNSNSMQVNLIRLNPYVAMSRLHIYADFRYTCISKSKFRTPYENQNNTRLKIIYK